MAMANGNGSAQKNYDCKMAMEMAMAGEKGKGKKTAEPRTTKWQNMNKNFVRPAAADKLKLMTILL